MLNQAAGRKEGRDPRTTDQRRADAFVQLLAGTPESRPRPQLHLTVSITSLLGLDREPADLSGCGPIPADLAKELAKDATWRRILTDPATGTVLDVGRTRYAPPADLDRFVRVRDGYCRFPGCRRRATGCDLDHTVRFPDGPTAAANLAALCRRHHRFKHESGWSVQPDQGRAGGLQWVSPRGARYRTEPPPPGEESSTMRIRPHPEDPLGDELLEVAWQSTLLAGPPN